MTPSIVYKAATLQPAGDGMYEFIASDETVDRYGDVIRVSGWELANYKKNPIVLFGHDKSLPVGIAPKVWVESKKLMIGIKLANEGTSPFIDTVRKLVDQKIIRAVSVGFLPTAEPKYLRDEANDRVTGMEFVGQELLENSLVTVPANPAALSTVKSMGIPEQHIERVFTRKPAGASAHLARQRAVLEMAKLGVSSTRF